MLIDPLAFLDRTTETKEIPDHGNGETQPGKSRHPFPGRKAAPVQANFDRNERGPASSDRERPTHPNRDPQRAAGQVFDGPRRSAHGAGLDVGGHRRFNQILVSKF